MNYIIKISSGSTRRYVKEAINYTYNNVWNVNFTAKKEDAYITDLHEASEIVKSIKNDYKGMEISIEQR